MSEPTSRMEALIAELANAPANSTDVPARVIAAQERQHLKIRYKEEHVDVGEALAALIFIITGAGPYVAMTNALPGELKSQIVQSCIALTDHLNRRVPETRSTKLHNAILNSRR